MAIIVREMQQKKGAKADLPTLKSGQIALCDTNEIYMGNYVGDGNLQIPTGNIQQALHNYYWYFNADSVQVKWTQLAASSANNLQQLTHLTRQITAPFDGIAMLKIQCTTSNNAETLGKNVIAPILYKGLTAGLTQTVLNSIAIQSNVYEIYTDANDRRQAVLFYSIPITKDDNIIAGIQAGTGAEDTEGTMQRFRAELTFIPAQVTATIFDYSGAEPQQIGS